MNNKKRLLEIHRVLLSMGLYGTMRELEREYPLPYSAINTLSQPFVMLRNLILDGEFSLAIEFIENIENEKHPYHEIQLFKFLILKQQFLELIWDEKIYDNEENMDDIIPSPQVVLDLLQNIRQCCNEEEFKSLCYCLTINDSHEHPYFNKWNKNKGRWDTFQQIYMTLTPKIRISDNKLDIKTEKLKQKYNKNKNKNEKKIINREKKYHQNNNNNNNNNNNEIKEIKINEIKEEKDMSYLNEVEMKKEVKKPELLVFSPPNREKEKPKKRKTKVKRTEKKNEKKSNKKNYSENENENYINENENNNYSTNNRNNHKYNETDEYLNNRNNQKYNETNEYINNNQKYNETDEYINNNQKYNEADEYINNNQKYNETDEYINNNQKYNETNEYINNNQKYNETNEYINNNHKYNETDEYLDNKKNKKYNENNKEPKLNFIEETYEKQKNENKRIYNIEDEFNNEINEIRKSKSKIRLNDSNEFRKSNNKINENDKNKDKNNINYNDINNKINEEFINSINSNKLNNLQPQIIYTDRQPIRTALFSPSSKFIAIGTNSHDLHLFTVNYDISNESPEVIHIHSWPERHRGSVYCLDWHNSLPLIATGSNDKTIKIAKVPDRFLLTDEINNNKLDNFDSSILFYHGSTIRDLKFLKGSFNNYLISAGAGEFNINIWDIEHQYNNNNNIQHSPLPYKTLYGHNGPIFALDSTDEGYIFSGGEDCTLNVWDIRQENKVAEVGSDVIRKKILSLSILSKDSFYNVATAHKDGSICFFDIRFPQRPFYSSSFQPHQKECRSATFSPDGSYLLTSSFDGKSIIHQLNLDDLKKGMGGDIKTSVHSILEAHEGKVTKGSWNSSSSSIITCGTDSKVILWS